MQVKKKNITTDALGPVLIVVPTLTGHLPPRCGERKDANRFFNHGFTLINTDFIFNRETHKNKAAR